MTTKKKAVKTKAKTATQNTIIQGLIAAVLMGAATGVLDALNKGTFSWHTIEIAVITSVITSGVAYLQHAYVGPYYNILRNLNNGDPGAS